MDYGYLQHHGIKGMKWGVRRANPGGAGGSDSPRKPFNFNATQSALGRTSGALNNAADKRENQRREAAKVNSRLDAMHMSDKELKARVERLNMEENYTRMMTTRETEMNRGEAEVDKILRTASTVISVGMSAVTLAAAVQQLKK